MLLRADGPALGARLRRGPGREDGIVEYRPPPARLAPVEEHVHDHAMEPRREAGLATVLVDAAQQAQEDVLRDVAGLSRIGGQVQRERVDLVLAGLEQL